MSIAQKRKMNIGSMVAFGNFVAKNPRRTGTLHTRYPGTMSGDLFEHILAWLDGKGTWRSSDGVFRNW